MIWFQLPLSITKNTALLGGIFGGGHRRKNLEPTRTVGV